jgi:hypothetical protein
MDEQYVAARSVVSARIGIQSDVVHQSGNLHKSTLTGRQPVQVLEHIKQVQGVVRH